MNPIGRSAYSPALSSVLLLAAFFLVDVFAAALAEAGFAAVFAVVFLGAAFFAAAFGAAFLAAGFLAAAFRRVGFFAAFSAISSSASSKVTSCGSRSRGMVALIFCHLT